MFGFFKKKDIQSEILTDLEQAKKSIKVAVSWLTDPLLITTLIDKKREGIEIKVLVSSNELNIIRFELFKKLQDLGGLVQKWGNKDTEQGSFMHYKFYIIDDNFAKSGSYNWSINAKSNAEALDEVVVNKKIDEFNEIFPHSVDFFYEIENPEQKRAELESIRKEKNQEVLTPDMLNAYRETQKIRAEYENKIKQAKIESDRKIEQERFAKEQLIREEAERKQNEAVARERETQTKLANERIERERLAKIESDRKA